MRNLKQNETLDHSMHHSYESNSLKDFLKESPILFNFAKSVFIFFYYILIQGGVGLNCFKVKK